MSRSHQSPITSYEVRRGLHVSIFSLAWTIGVGGGAIALGVLGNSLVLVVFGAIDLLDAGGSASLVVHFRHSLHHEAISERHERLVLRIVTVGMASVGVATIVVSCLRLVSRHSSSPAIAAVVLTGVSAVVLAMLARAKRRIAARIPSHALHADGWLSAVGSLLALVAVGGTGLSVAFGWWWIDPAAAIGVAGGALGLSVSLALTEDLR
jgi:divalent metal cation (Fe/Co/Zn/Cd) transporter